MTGRLVGRQPWAAVLFALTLVGEACDPYPRDPEDTLERVTGGTLRVGAAESPPWLMRSGRAATGPEAELIEAFARSRGARVDWHWGPAHQHLEALERFELDVVAAGLTAASPWQSRVALTRPWRVDGDTRHVLAVAPGENGMLVALERLIETRRRSGSP